MRSLASRVNRGGRVKVKVAAHDPERLLEAVGGVEGTSG